MYASLGAHYVWYTMKFDWFSEFSSLFCYSAIRNTLYTVQRIFKSYIMVFVIIFLFLHGFWGCISLYLCVSIFFCLWKCCYVKLLLFSAKFFAIPHHHYRTHVMFGSILKDILKKKVSPKMRIWLVHYRYVFIEKRKATLKQEEKDGKQEERLPVGWKSGNNISHIFAKHQKRKPL